MTGVYRFTFSVSGIEFEFGAAIVKEGQAISSLAYINAPRAPPLSDPSDVNASYSASTDTITECLQDENVGVEIMFMTTASNSFPMKGEFSLISFTGQFLSKMKVNP